MKKITLDNKYITVSATFKNDESLEEVLRAVEGLIIALGYCFDGHLGIEDDDR